MTIEELREYLESFDIAITNRYHDCYAFNFEGHEIYLLNKVIHFYRFASYDGEPGSIRTWLSNRYAINTIAEAILIDPNTSNKLKDFIIFNIDSIAKYMV